MLCAKFEVGCSGEGFRKCRKSTLLAPGPPEGYLVVLPIGGLRRAIPNTMPYTGGVCGGHVTEGPGCASADTQAADGALRYKKQSRGWSHFALSWHRPSLPLDPCRASLPAARARHAASLLATRHQYRRVPGSLGWRFSQIPRRTPWARSLRPRRFRGKSLMVQWHLRPTIRPQNDNNSLECH